MPPEILSDLSDLGPNCLHQQTSPLTKEELIIITQVGDYLEFNI